MKLLGIRPPEQIKFWGREEKVKLKKLQVNVLLYFDNFENDFKLLKSCLLIF